MTPQHNNGCLSIVPLNIRSIRNKIDFIHDHLSDFDIMCFTETHLDNTILDSDQLVDTHDSTIFRHDLTAHSGGLLVYVSNSFLFERRHDLELSSVHSIWVEVKHRNLSFLLCTVYRSPATAMSFWENLNISLEKAYESNKNIIIVGDLNQDLLNDSSHLRNVMAINTLTNVINKSTRVTNNTATLFLSQTT